MADADLAQKQKYAQKYAANKNKNKNMLGIPQEIILCIHLPSMALRQVVRTKLGQI